MNQPEPIHISAAVEKQVYVTPELTILTLQDTEAGARFTGQPENVDYTPS